MAKEDIEKALGKFGDYDERLARDFGEAYLDGPDNTHDNIPEGFEGSNVLNIDGVLKRFKENLPEITCEENQAITIKTIRGQSVSVKDMFTSFAHLKGCSEYKCQRLDLIACQDKYGATPEQMIAEAKSLGLIE